MQNATEVDVIFVKKQVDSLENTSINIVKVIKYGSGIFSYISFCIRSIFYVIFESYDIIHAHYGFHSAFIPAIFKKKPLVITFHGSDARIEPFRNKLFYP